MKISFLAHTTPYSGIPGISMGISKYIYNLAAELSKMHNDVEMFIRDDYVPKESWIKTVRSPKATWILYPFFLGKKLNEIKSDIYHADYVTTGAPLIAKNKRPSVVSIHDAIPFTYNKKAMPLADRFRLMWYMTNFKKIVSSDAITVLSEYSKKQILEYTKLPEEKIHINYISFDHKQYFPLKKIPHRKTRIGYLGGLDGRKNVKLLVNVFESLVKERDDIELFVAGGGRSLEEFVSRGIKNARFLGKMPDSKANSFLNSLDIFVFPSLDEGFGLPPLEAMACGIPVISSNKASMPEVVGDAGILVDPENDNMANALIKLIENKGLRHRLSKKGLERSKKFTWKRCAEDTMKIYNQLLVGCDNAII